MSERFKVSILERYCKGCALCVEFCPQDKLYIRQKPDKRGIRLAAVRLDIECTACLRCAQICPDAAIEVFRISKPVASEAEAK
ncbi:MAG: ferredoxin family protein [Planctomycetes bacterium]|nr:ferredoxin family protein [Planctomycetota bacterium]